MIQEQEQNVIWPQDLQDDPMAAGAGDEDFTKYLDLDNDFQFGGLENGHSGLDTPMGRLGFGQNDIGSIPGMTMYGEHQQMPVDMPNTTTSASFADAMPVDQGYHTFQQYHQMPMGQHYRVPPTPVSSEMHAAKYGHQIDPAGHVVFDGRQISFTPLVSPAQTPMDHGFMPEYAMGDDFFSPLTSPAIEAQTAFSSAGTTASPIDMAAEQPLTGKAPSKRSRRKGSVSLRTPARSVKHSPAMKPQTRRRQPSVSHLPMDKIETMLNQSSQGRNLKPNVLGSNVSGGSDDSVSPEPLSEALMRPPPIPMSSGKSPKTLVGAQPTSSVGPVTPATLMRMPSNQSISSKAAEQAKTSHAPDEQMDDMMLPDAVAPPERLVFSEVDTSKGDDEDQSTPTLSAKSTKISAASTPRSSLTKIGSQESFSKPAKVEGRGGRTAKKRPSTSSAAISPALRPKISPSISPLVPASGPGISHISAETSALYLASKSNYQNILEGTHLPGVSYPDNLAENLSSKRTSHKIAEQGRRNRINLALKEIESLLPPSITAGINKKDRPSSNEDVDKGAASGQGASKASTVEMAILYIRNLQAELKMTKDKLATVEKKISEGGSDAENQTSD